MNKLSEEVGRITNILEDAIEEKDWSIVQSMIDALDDVYSELDKQESGYNY